MVSLAIAAVLMRPVSLSAPNMVHKPMALRRHFADPTYTPIHDIWCSSPIIEADGKMHLVGTFELSFDWDPRVGWGDSGNMPKVFYGVRPNPAKFGPFPKDNGKWIAMTNLVFKAVNSTTGNRLMSFDATFGADAALEGVVAISLYGTPADVTVKYDPKDPTKDVTYPGKPEMSFAVTVFPTVALSPTKLNNVIPIELISFEDLRGYQPTVRLSDPDKLHFFAFNTWAFLPDIYGFDSSSASPPLDMSTWPNWIQVSNSHFTKSGIGLRHGQLVPDDLGSYDWVLISASDPTGSAYYPSVKTYECDGVVRYVK